MSNKIQWPVGIDGAENGFIVSVGCKRFVFEEHSKLLDELDAYLSGRETPLSSQVKKELSFTLCPPSQAPPQAYCEPQEQAMGGMGQGQPIGR